MLESSKTIAQAIVIQSIALRMKATKKRTFTLRDATECNLLRSHLGTSSKSPMDHFSLC